MNDKFPPNMETAKARLEQVLRRLEEVVTRDEPGQGGASEALAAELGALRKEHQTLGQRLREMEADYEALRQVTDTVSRRLDATIGELKSLLDS